MRFSKDKKIVQNSVNDLSTLKNELKSKIYAQNDEDSSGEYDDDNYREEAIRELEKEFLKASKEKKPEVKNGGALKFIEKSNERSNNILKQQAIELIKKLENDEEFDYDSNDELKADNKYEGRLKAEKISKSKFETDISNSKNGPAIGIEKSLKTFLKEKDNIENPIKKVKISTNEDDLIKGINVNKISDSRVIKKFANETEIKEILNENQDDIFKNLLLKNVAVTNENVDEFDNEKEMLAKSKEVKKPILSGWGTWAGPDTVNKKPIDNIEENIRKIVYP